LARASLLALAACGEDPRRVDTRAIADADVVDAVLGECHQPLRGRMDRISATVEVPGLGSLVVFAHLPDQVRVQRGGRGVLVLGDDVVPAKAGDEPPTTAEASQFRMLRFLVDAAAFGPLHRATACRRVGPDRFELEAANGASCHLQLRSGSLLPAALRAGDLEAHFVDYLRTPTSWIAQVVEVNGLGRCRVHFQQFDFAWDAEMFTRPDQARDDGAPKPATLRLSLSGETRSPTPILVAGREVAWTVVPDPGSWPERVAAYRRLHAELLAQDQWVAGFPGFWRDDRQALMGAPFRQRTGGRALVRPNDWLVIEVPAGRWLIVYPPAGDLEARIAAGTRMLRDALAQQRLVARGPITAQPYFHLHEGEPAPDKLAAPTVRMAVAVE
jgi:hypothetical protein